MRSSKQYQKLLKTLENRQNLLAVLIDPEKFDPDRSVNFLDRIPKDTTHVFVGGSTVPESLTDVVVKALKLVTHLPVFLFPGDANQISEEADALLFLSLLSGDNPKYLIGQQVQAAAYLKTSHLEVIPTSYILIDGGNHSAVARVTDTSPILQNDIDKIVHTALAGQLMGAKLVYLEAGSGANIPVHTNIVKAVSEVLDIPIVVGGGIRTQHQKEATYAAGANMVVMGTVYEDR